jgi:hypothetical protein
MVQATPNHMTTSEQFGRALAAWAAASAAGRHRDGAPLPDWMAQSNAFGRSQKVLPQKAEPLRSDTSRCIRASGSFCCWAGRSRAVFS